MLCMYLSSVLPPLPLRPLLTLLLLVVVVVVMHARALPGKQDSAATRRTRVVMRNTTHARMDHSGRCCINRTRRQSNDATPLNKGFRMRQKPHEDSNAPKSNATLTNVQSRPRGIPTPNETLTQ